MMPKIPIRIIPASESNGKAPPFKSRLAQHLGEEGRLAFVAAQNTYNTPLDQAIRRFDELMKMITPVPEEWLNRTTPSVDSLGLVTLDTIESQEFEWAWDKRIVQRGVTVFAGEGGVGKTFIIIDIVSRVSRGIAFPDGAPCRQGRTLYFSAEDDPETVLRPRFETHGADCSQITIQGQDAETLLNLGDKKGAGIKSLEEAIKSFRGEVRLVVFDPLTAFLSGKDINRDDEVRSVFRPLTAIAQRYKLAIIAVMHFGKDTTINAKYRTLGSVGFVNAARAAWAVGKEFDEDAITHLVQTKRNYSKPMSGLSFTIREVAKDKAKLVWEEGPSPVEVADLGKGNRSTRLESVVKWIESYCTKKGTDSVTDAHLQQSGLPGTKGNADYCRNLIQQLGKAGHGTVFQEGRKSLRFRPSCYGDSKNVVHRSKPSEKSKNSKT